MTVSPVCKRLAAGAFNTGMGALNHRCGVGPPDSGARILRGSLVVARLRRHEPRPDLIALLISQMPTMNIRADDIPHTLSIVGEVDVLGLRLHPSTDARRRDWISNG